MFKGPVGSAKTSLCLLKIWMAFEYIKPSEDGKKRQRWAIVRNTMESIRTTTLNTWRDWYPADEFGPLHGNPPVYHYDDSEHELEVLFFGLDTEDDIKKIKSLDLTGVFVNEADKIQSALIIRTLSERTGRYPSKVTGGGGLYKSLLIGDLNSDGPRGWIRESFKTVPPRGWRLFSYPPALVRAGHETNLNRDEYAIDAHGDKWINNPEAYYIGNASFPRYWLNLAENNKFDYINTQLLSNWGTATDGKPVHPNYSDHVHCSKTELVANPHLPITLGFDLGNTPACAITQRQTDGTLFVLDEVASTQDFLEPFISEKVIPLLDARYPHWRKSHESCHDPADMGSVVNKNSTAVAIFSKYGIKSIPAKSNGLDFRRNCLAHFLSKLVNGHPAFLINERCPLLREALGGEFHYKFTSATRNDTTPLIKVAPEKNFHSHIAEALEYNASIFVGERYFRKHDSGNAQDFSVSMSRTPVKRVL